ncbi:MAG: DUF695 domain-containing protein, partial [Bacteroidota bacterium]
MSFLKSYLKKEEDLPDLIQNFWQWFTKHEQQFFKIIKEGTEIHEKFFSKLGPRLKHIDEGIFYLVGLHDKYTAELIFTAEGDVEKVFFVEELVSKAPVLNGWRFTALKPKTRHTRVATSHYEFTNDNIDFYDKFEEAYPDEINIVLTHTKLNETNEETLSTGIYLFLDNLLGELELISLIDDVQFITKERGEKKWIPITKLNDYLTWRQKEFVEKY